MIYIIVFNQFTGEIFHESEYDESIINILGEPYIKLGRGTVMYYNYGGHLRLLVDTNGK